MPGESEQAENSRCDRPLLGSPDAEDGIGEPEEDSARKVADAYGATIILRSSHARASSLLAAAALVVLGVIAWMCCPPMPDAVRKAMMKVHGLDFGAHSASMLAEEHRQPICDRKAACFLGESFPAGDHVHFAGRLMQDAERRNLCWVKLPRDHTGLGSILSKIPRDGVISMTDGVEHMPREQIPCATLAGRLAPGRFMEDVSPRSHPVQSSTCDIRNMAEAANHSWNETVVLHVRSGYTMQSPYGFYPQPPCAYYVDIVEHGLAGGAFGHALIVTESDPVNPCVEVLKSTFPGKVRVQNNSITTDACAFALARNLALGFGSWGVAIARLSRNLKRLYLPVRGDLDNSTNSTIRQSLSKLLPVHEGAAYSQLVYAFPGFRTSWAKHQDMKRDMVHYPNTHLVKRSFPAAS